MMSCKSECSGCYYENELRAVKDLLRSTNEELEDLREELEKMRHSLACAKGELEAVKRAYCLARKDLLQEQEKTAKLERELAEAKDDRSGEDTRPYVDFLARLRRTMLTAPDLLAEEA